MRARRAASDPGRDRLLGALDDAGARARLAVEGHDVAVTHLDRIYWPADAVTGTHAITKRDFLRYLVRIAPVMLPHLSDRPLTIFRWPEGITGRRVLEKHWNIALPSFVERVDVFSESKGRPDQYLLCNNLATLVWLGQMGTLEFHLWHSRVRPGTDATSAGVDFADSAPSLQSSLLERPDYILFDLDPFIYAGDEKGREPGVSGHAFARAKETAAWLHALLAGIGLPAFVKTSGKTGLHVAVPIRRTLTFGVVREMAHVIGARLVRVHPDAVTLEWPIGKRTGKVFIDANMNVRGKSMTAPYSPRGLPGAPVSMPFRWARLAQVDVGDFHMGNVPGAVARQGDAWAGWLSRKARIEDALAAAAR